MSLSIRVVLGALFATILLVSACDNNCSGHGDCENDVCNCEEKWTGSDCSQYNCTEHADCSGHGQCRSSKCVCHTGYGSHDCSATTTNCNNHCHGHGSCLDGICTCDRGYTGPDCGRVDSSITCPGNCSGHGFCDSSQDPPTCRCMPSYWSGEACDIEQSRCPTNLNNCTGHGICAPVDPLGESSPWVCNCEQGFCGDSCEVACPSCPNNCTGHGICRGSTCECTPGFGGDDCSTAVPVPGCPNSCSGHGRCERKTKSTFHCVCNGGYTGSSCAVSVVHNPSNCTDNGEVLSDGTCACYPGFAGADCELELQTCDSHKNCSANGVCKNGTCVCQPGFAGSDCNVACPSGLGNVGCNADRKHGTCQSDGTCACRDGEWEGVACEKRVTESDLASVASSNNPIGVIVLSVVAVAALVMLGGFAFNYFHKGKRGLNAVPGMDAIRSSMKGDDYESAPENRYASNY